MIKQNQRHLNQILIISDISMLALSFSLAWYVKFYSGMFPIRERLSFEAYLYPMLGAAALMMVVNHVISLYDQYRSKSVFEEIMKIARSNLVTLVIFLGILFIFKISDYSRSFVLMVFAMNAAGASLSRAALRVMLRSMRRRGFNMKSCLIVGVSGVCDELLERIRANRHWGYDVSGILSDDLEKGSLHGDVEIIGTIDEIEGAIRLKNPDEVFIALPLDEYRKLGKVVLVCEKEGIKTLIVPDYLSYIPAKPHVEDLDGLTVINIRKVPLEDMLNRAVKRVFDILFSLAVIILLSPVFLLCAAITGISSPGPVIFKQERIGRNRKSFFMYKFRSMHVRRQDGEDTGWTRKDDPRRTRWGTFMRRTSLDELPQFFNVLMGDMSVVGPRPERPHFVDHFKEDIPKYMIKHQVRPGITGWAQIFGWRGDTSIEKRIEFDLFYIENWTFALDIRIILLTIFKGFVNDNAY